MSSETVRKALEVYLDNMVDPTKAKQPKAYPLALGMLCWKSEPFIYRFLHHLRNFVYPKEKLHLYWLVQDPELDNTISILEDFRFLYKKEYASINIKHIKGIRVKGKANWIVNIVRNRNKIIEWSKPYDILWLDHDTYCPWDTIASLVKGKALGADICSGVVPILNFQGGEWKAQMNACFLFEEFLKKHPRSPCLHGLVVLKNAGACFPNWVLKNKFWVDRIGTGCAYMTREVLDKVKFRYPPKKKYGEKFQMTDDIYYCERARKKGFKIMADFGVFCRHVGIKVFFHPLTETLTRIQTFAVRSERTKRPYKSEDFSME